jgi:hypothetical protein
MGLVELAFDPGADVPRTLDLSQARVEHGSAMRAAVVTSVSRMLAWPGNSMHLARSTGPIWSAVASVAMKHSG